MSDTPWTDERERVGKIRSSGALMGVVPAVYVRELESELAEARAEIERKNETIDACSIMLRARETLISKQMKLIEQMREALQYALTEARSTECERLIEAALSAAGRGEG